MTIDCNPCVCPNQWINSQQTWRQAVITLLCTSGSSGADSVDLLTDILASLGGVPTPAVYVHSELDSSAILPYPSWPLLAAAVVATYKTYVIVNGSNRDVKVSFDAGATTAFIVPAGTTYPVNLVDNSITEIRACYVQIVSAGTGTISFSGIQ